MPVESIQLKSLYKYWQKPQINYGDLVRTKRKYLVARGIKTIDYQRERLPSGNPRTR